MRITFLNSLYPPHGAAGAENTLRLLVRDLSSRGHECSIISLTPEPRGSWDKIDGVPVAYVPLANVYWPHGGPRRRVLRPMFQLVEAFNPVMGRRVGKLLRRLAPDVLNCHNLQGFSAAGWMAAQRLGIPIVQTIHDYYVVCPRSAMWRPRQGNCQAVCPECRVISTPRRILSTLPAAITCVSHRVFDRLSAAGAFPRARQGRQPVRIIRGNNPEVADPPSRRSGEGTLTVGFIGRIEPSKGLDNLLDAVGQLPAVTLLVAGKGEADYLAALHSRVVSRSRVRFLGYIRPADFFPQIDLLAIPSAWADPFPRVFHEALAYGVPSLVTPLGGLSEVIQSGRTGFIAGGSDAEALRRALTELLGGNWDREATRRECRAAADAYRADRIATQYEGVLSAVAAHRSVPEQAGELWRPKPPGGKVRVPCPGGAGGA